MEDELILTEKPVAGDFPHDPLTKKYYLELPEPDLDDHQADVDRVCRALRRDCGNVSVPLELMRMIPAVCREGGWRVTATVGYGQNGFRLVDLEPGDKTGRHFGLAVDLGTTTVVAYLVDLRSGEVTGLAAAYNAQVALGEDILTRLYLAGSPEGLTTLQKAARQTVNDLVSRLEKECSVSGREISALTIGANPTMVHLFLGLDPSHICMAPYLPVVNKPGFLAAGELGLEINPQAVVYCLPGVGSYVGGDVIGGVLVSGLHRRDELALFVDIGTNGEIVLGNRDWLIACAGAAGPALEGGVAKNGMRAEKGAIDRVEIDPDTLAVRYTTIGNAPPVGICGSGLVDCLAGLFLAGIVDRAGKFKRGDRFVLVPAEKSATRQDIAVTQTDINNLLRTKGAVNAALELLLESVGAGLAQIERFYAAGAFGRHLDLESAVTIGLYPDLPRDRMVCLGNSSGEGARQVLLSNQRRLEAEEIAERITYFELNSSQTFMNKFISSKFLPHTNLDYFPTVKARLAARKQKMAIWKQS